MPRHATPALGATTVTEHSVPGNTAPGNTAPGNTAPGNTAPEVVLAAEDVSIDFGGLHALDGVTMEVRAGEAVGIIGPNGAGKTTFLNCVSGLLTPTRGRIWVGSEEVSTLRAHQIAAKGVARTFQAPFLMPKATVLSNVMLGAHLAMRAMPVSNLLYVGRTRREERMAAERAEHTLSFLDLARYRDRVASEIPHGVAKLVEVARALVQRPKLLLLDEPTSGMTPSEKSRIVDILAAVRAELGVTLVIIEHDVPFIRTVCDRLVVLNFGRVLAAGPPDDVLRDEKVRQGYLGQLGTATLAHHQRSKDLSLFTTTRR